jgi:hypothetical protein
MHLPYLLAVLLLAAAAAPPAAGQTFDDDAVTDFLRYGVFEMRSSLGDRDLAEFHDGAMLVGHGTAVDPVAWTVTSDGAFTRVVFDPAGEEPVRARVLTFDESAITVAIESPAGTIDDQQTTFSLLDRMSPADYRRFRSAIVGTWLLERMGPYDVSELNITFRFGTGGTFSFDAREAQAMGAEALVNTPLLLTQLIARGAFETGWIASAGAYQAHAPDHDREGARHAIALHSDGRSDGYFVIEEIAAEALTIGIGGAANPDLRMVLRRTF